MAKRKEIYGDLLKYCIGIMLADGHMKYVTGIEYSPKAAYWKYGEPAMMMTYEKAKDVAFGLSVNGTPALVITMFDGICYTNDFRGLGNFDPSLYEE